MILKNRFLIIFLVSFFFSPTLFGDSLKEHTKLWGTTVIIGSLFKDTNFKYYLEPQIRFIDNKYRFEEAFLYAGIGYQFFPNFILFIGDAEVVSKSSTTGQIVNQNRIWQQANWIPMNQDGFSLINRTRLEERKNYSEKEWAVRLRERLMARIPIKNSSNHSIVVFDEIFLDLNHPNWVNTNSLFSQNRSFIGLGTKLSKETNFDVGYLNQYQFTNPNQMSNILLFMLTINC